MFGEDEKQEFGLDIEEYFERLVGLTDDGNRTPNGVVLPQDRFNGWADNDT